MDDDNAIVAGIVNVMDLEGVTMAHFLQMTPSLMKKMVVSGQVFFMTCISYYLSF